jgi:hypothetical protein
MEFVQMLVLDIIVNTNEVLVRIAESFPPAVTPIWYGVVGFSFVLAAIRWFDLWVQGRRIHLIAMLTALGLTLLFGNLLLDLDFDRGFAEGLPGIFPAALAGIWCGRRAERWPDRLWWRCMLAGTVMVAPLFHGVNPSQICLTIITGYLIGLFIRWVPGVAAKDNLTEE